MASRMQIHPLTAYRAMRALREDPDDTVSAIRVIAALSGPSTRRAFERFRASPRGARILREKRDLYDLLTDHDRLKAMPPGSLGRTLVEWFEAEDISTEGLARASEAARDADPEATFEADEEIYRSRLRNLHDVFHVLTGYDRDLRGEAAVLAFTIAQDANLGIAYLVWNALREQGWRSPGGILIRQGYRRGRLARHLVLEDWETLFEQPIEQVRKQLGIGVPPIYEQVRSARAPGAPAISA